MRLRGAPCPLGETTSPPASGGVAALGGRECEWVPAVHRTAAPASKPGGDLLFHRLSDSTIGAVRFHGRVRDGIGWGTDAMTTKLWGRRVVRCGSEIDVITVQSQSSAIWMMGQSGLSLMVGLFKRE